MIRPPRIRATATKLANARAAPSPAADDEEKPDRDSDFGCSTASATEPPGRGRCSARSKPRRVSGLHEPEIGDLMRYSPNGDLADTPRSRWVVRQELEVAGTHLVLGRDPVAHSQRRAIRVARVVCRIIVSRRRV